MKTGLRFYLIRKDIVKLTIPHVDELLITLGLTIIQKRPE